MCPFSSSSWSPRIASRRRQLCEVKPTGKSLVWAAPCGPVAARPTRHPTYKTIHSCRARGGSLSYCPRLQLRILAFELLIVPRFLESKTLLAVGCVESFVGLQLGALKLSIPASMMSLFKYFRYRRHMGIGTYKMDEVQGVILRRCTYKHFSSFLDGWTIHVFLRRSWRFRCVLWVLRN